MTIEIRSGLAEQMDVETGSADAVVSTLVLCSVRNERAVLAEIRRVLKPGGQFVFVEHVAAAPGTRLRAVQHAMRPVWSCIAGGCQPNRDTLSAINQSGFENVEVENLRLPLGLIAPHIAGRAIR